MPKTRNKKKANNNETPYPHFDSPQATRGKKDGNNDAKKPVINKKMTPKNKTQNSYDNDRAEKSSEQMKPLELVKTELSPITYPDSINQKKYSTPTNFISSVMSPPTDNWKYTNRDEFESNSPFGQEDMLREEGTAYLFSKQIQFTDAGEAPMHTCHSVHFWLDATCAAFNPEHESYNGDISKDLRYLQLRMAVSDLSTIFTHKWRGNKLQATR
jgi:hypothetical protein